MARAFTFACDHKSSATNTCKAQTDVVQINIGLARGLAALVEHRCSRITPL
jgi:hypothetical protein